MRRVYRGDHAPITVLVDKPSTWSQALYHAAEGEFLLACKPKEYEACTDKIECAGTKFVQWITEDVVPVNVEIWEVNPIKVSGVDVGGYDSAVGPNLLGQPHSH